MVTRHNQIKGLTTAAGLWAAAAVGLATGIGFHEAAITGALVIFLTLSVLSSLDGRMHRRTDHFEAYVELPDTTSLGMFMDALQPRGIIVEDVQLDTNHALNDNGRSFLVMLSTSERMDRAELLDRIHLAVKDEEVALTGCRII